MSRKISTNSLEQQNLEKCMDKYNLSDSEESEIEDIKKLKSSARKRSGSFNKLEEEIYKKMQIKREKAIKRMKENKIKIENDNNSNNMIVSNFTKMMKRFKIRKELMSNLKQQGYKRPTAIQMASIPYVMSHKSIVATAPTGSGKTVAYALGILQNLIQGKFNQIHSQCIIILPTVELANQVWREVIMLGKKNQKQQLKIKLLQKINKQYKVFKQIFDSLDILVTTPLKFLKLCKKSELDLKNVEYLVLDEADKYFELGMVRQIQQIISRLKENQKVKYYFFSATIQQGVQELVENISNDFVKIQVGGFNNVLNTIEQRLVYTGNERGKLIEIQKMINKGEFVPPILMFMQSKERAKELQVELYNRNIKMEAIFNEKDTEERERIMEEFREQKIWVLICTDLIARGIDFKGVNLVINYDFPNDIITYIHRVGRTGRGGRTGQAITFYNDEDKPMLKSIANLLKKSGCQVPQWVFQIESINKIQKKKLKIFPVKRENISGLPDQLKKKIKQEQGQKQIKNEEQKKDENEELNK